jgi:hypothetical protein
MLTVVETVFKDWNEYYELAQALLAGRCEDMSTIMNFK